LGNSKARYLQKAVDDITGGMWLSEQLNVEAERMRRERERERERERD
jgi:hypothetical protein